MWSALTADRPAAPVDEREVAELKAWARRAWWAARRTPRQRARAVVELASRPWRFAKEAVRVLPKYAPYVSSRFGVPLRRQIAHLTWARVRYGLDPTSYYRFQLFRPERWRRAGAYVQTSDTGRVLWWLALETPGYRRVFGDKRTFEAWCLEHALPTVRTLMEFEHGKLTRALVPDGSLPAIDLFSKPSNSQGGKGAQRWTLQPDGSYVGPDGRARTPRDLLAELARMSVDLGRPIVVQPALRNAAADEPLTPGGLCTARMTTARHPGGEPYLLFAVYRMPVDASASVDNFASGGISSPINCATGRLLPAIRKDFGLQPEPAEHHPQTGAPIVGHQLPHWSEAVSLVLRAHRAVTWNGVPVIGWDVALLEDGPILVEGNNVPCSTLAQMVLEQPLGESPVVACLNAHLRERFDASPAPN